jgi:DNA-binding SARP family transcriptional activator
VEVVPVAGVALGGGSSVVSGDFEVDEGGLLPERTNEAHRVHGGAGEGDLAPASRKLSEVGADDRILLEPCPQRLVTDPELSREFRGALASRLRKPESLLVELCRVRRGCLRYLDSFVPGRLPKRSRVDPTRAREGQVDARALPADPWHPAERHAKDAKTVQCAVATYAKLLGRAAIRHEGRWLQPPAGKTSALLYFLAYNGDWVRRDELTYLFWPDSTEDEARRNLRRILTTIRALPYANAFESDARRLRWSIDTDVHAFQQALSGQRLATAAELYEGALLDGLGLPSSPEFERWLELERQACHERWRLSLLEWSTEFEAVDRFREAGEVLARLYRADAFDEEVLRRYVRALHASGQRTKALEAFNAFTASLKTELGAEPEHATAEIGDAIRRGQPCAFTPPETTVTNADPKPRPKHNLAAQPTAFIGRDADRAKLTAVLGEPTTRLVTIVGPGGMGKTRLAVEVARAQVDGFEHGVFFVGFDSVVSPELMAYAVADVLGFSFFGARSPEEQLREHLRSKELLLVLDNLEHLLAGLQWISDLLESAAGVTILATSRERLNVRAERVFDLASLPVPDDGEHEAEHCDAVRLFAQSAAAVKSGFSPDAANVSAVVRICRLVHGLPLAIEMAARWLRTLDPDAIATELERRRRTCRCSATPTRSSRADRRTARASEHGDEQRAREVSCAGR